MIKAWSCIFILTLMHSVAKPSRSEYESSPKNIDSTKMRFDVVTNELKKIESKCDGNMRFQARHDNEMKGECDCDHLECRRPLLYSPKTKQCHYAWSQGPCAKGEWYILPKDLQPVCERNNCPASPDDALSHYYFKSHDDEMCYQEGTAGNCKNDEILLAFPFEPVPVCRIGTICYEPSIPMMQECIPGNKKAHDGCKDFKPAPWRDT